MGSILNYGGDRSNASIVRIGEFARTESWTLNRRQGRLLNPSRLCLGQALIEGHISALDRVIRM